MLGSWEMYLSKPPVLREGVGASMGESAPGLEGAPWLQEGVWTRRAWWAGRPTIQSPVTGSALGSLLSPACFRQQAGALRMLEFPGFPGLFSCLLAVRVLWTSREREWEVGRNELLSWSGLVADLPAGGTWALTHSARYRHARSTRRPDPGEGHPRATRGSLCPL